MREKNFTSNEIIKYAWTATTKNFWLLLLTVIIVFLIYYIGIFLSTHFFAGPLAIIPLAYLIFEVGVWVGLVKFLLKLSRGEKAEIKDLFTAFNYLPSYVIASVLYILIVDVGLLLLIIPGIIWAIKYLFFSFLIVDENLSPIEALKRSGEITKGAKWRIFVLLLVLLVINFIGGVFAGIGLLVTIPLSWMSIVHVYNILKGTKSLPEEADKSIETAPIEPE